MPPASRAKPVPGRHRTPQPRQAGPGAHRGQPSRAERQAQRDQAALQREGRERNQRYRRAPGQVARTVTVREGGQHALMAEFLLFTGIVAMRAIADYVPGDQGQPTEGTTKGQITPRGSQLGPLPTLAAGFVIFFLLSFAAARGGGAARAAAAAGLIIDMVLLLRSMPELATVSQSFGNVRASAQQQAAYPSTYVQPVGYQGTAPGPYAPIPDATGIFPVITPTQP
jgi:hypothetical protein